MIWAAFKNDPNDEEALRAIDLLYDTSLISSGSTVSDLFCIFYIICLHQICIQ
ncbi:unnamed protein product [Camellia sinensis]